MFPVAHAWLIERMVSAPTPAHYLGCVWPDMLFGSPLAHTESHRSGTRLAQVAQALPPGSARDEFCAFVVGALSHGTKPHGFDWYSDEQYSDAPEQHGYAFQHGRAIATETARACGIGRWGSERWASVNIVFVVPAHSLRSR